MSDARLSDLATPATLLETHGAARDFGAFVVGAVFDRAGRQAGFALGDGTVRLADTAQAGAEWTVVQAHDGAALCLSTDAQASGFVCGGDDGLFQRITASGELQKIAGFGGKWVEQAASFSDGKSGFVACTAGKFVHLFDATGEKLRSLEHPSTVTGIAFDAKGKRLAASHYNGTSLWFTNSSSATPRRLEWKGSHTGVILHPAAEAVVSCMQENALHGWRLPDGHDMRMSGYPAKPESLSFSRSGKYLASSGAEAVVLWPFFGGGPMGKPPLELAQQENIFCTRVACHPTDEMVAAGYADGSVLLAEITSCRVMRIAPPSGSAVSALAWSKKGQLAFGNEQGRCSIIDFTRPRAEA